ncbi:MAG: ATP-dependent Clp protease proteolytic subunit [Candidatus Dormibacteria bacterium]
MMVIGEITAETLGEYFNASILDNVRFGGGGRVIISSPGGDIGYMLAMLDDIDFWKRETFATGICQSAAAVLATAGEGKRVCTMDTLFRFIPPVAEKIDDGNGNIVEKIPDLRYFLHSVCVARLAARLKCPKPEIELLFDGQFISSIRAKEFGLIDEVISTEVKNGNSGGFSGSEGPIGRPINFDEYAGFTTSSERCT